MAMGQQKDRQGDLMVSWSEMLRSPGRVFYDGAVMRLRRLCECLHPARRLGAAPGRFMPPGDARPIQTTKTDTGGAQAHHRRPCPPPISPPSNTVQPGTQARARKQPPRAANFCCPGWTRRSGGVLRTSADSQEETFEVMPH